jgi:hypothetical protein
LGNCPPKLAQTLELLLSAGAGELLFCVEKRELQAKKTRWQVECFYNVNICS